MTQLIPGLILSCRHENFLSSHAVYPHLKVLSRVSRSNFLDIYVFTHSPTETRTLRVSYATERTFETENEENIFVFASELVTGYHFSDNRVKRAFLPRPSFCVNNKEKGTDTRIIIKSLISFQDDARIYLPVPTSGQSGQLLPMLRSKFLLEEGAAAAAAWTGPEAAWAAVGWLLICDFGLPPYHLLWLRQVGRGLLSGSGLEWQEKKRRRRKKRKDEEKEE